MTRLQRNELISTENRLRDMIYKAEELCGCKRKFFADRLRISYPMFSLWMSCKRNLGKDQLMILDNVLDKFNIGNREI